MWCSDRWSKAEEKSPPYICLVPQDTWSFSVPFLLWCHFRKSLLERQALPSWDWTRSSTFGRQLCSFVWGALAMQPGFVPMAGCLTRPWCREKGVGPASTECTRLRLPKGGLTLLEEGGWGGGKHGRGKQGGVEGGMGGGIVAGMWNE